MNPTFGEIKQLGIVTRDIDRSMRYFVDAWNIGPWYVQRHMEMDTLYKGTPSRVDLSVALSNSGTLEFEIIEQHNEADSVYRDFVRSVPDALHVQHMAVWPEDYAKTKAAALAKGWYPVLENKFRGESCYLAHPSEPNFCFEISNRSPEKEFFRNTIRDIAVNWDGKNPIREGFPKLPKLPKA